LTKQPLPGRAALILTFAAAVSVLFSIAVSQSLMALALAALLVSGEKLRFPPVKLPLALFLAGTVISLALSDHPSAGRPQIRKFFVFLMLLLVFSALRELRHLRALVVAWAVLAALSSAWAIAQFADKYQRARALQADFYEFYVAERITGFMSHWMTFSGQMMLVLLLVAAGILFGPWTRRLAAVWAASGLLIAAAIVLGFTRGIWLATAAGMLYLLWQWRRWAVALVPAVALVTVLLGPASLRERVASALRPRGEVDSNQHRIVSWRTGWRMIQAHPWFGLGPEHVKLQFDEYVPADVPRPLPKGWYGHLHNIYLHYAAERGVPAALALLWLLGKILADFARAARRALPEMRFLLHGAVAAVVAVLVEGFFELNLGDTEVLTMFLALVAAGYVALEQAAPEAARA
jgi:putative inorganic carbon (HCO3(-)) transporter